ncbi:DUF298-domain-containing protein [Hygrophoropsis aurantiaca]|uniref:DUF298-domain-containing protein n=1 Tax=Hygrophoropsis aurantiaca TaxID=72124 RepID=A0ACB8AAZ7_9AGAM|nr:DUF298-domain-containing protein [Hygrophoropsis aurantiaca]
MGKFTRAEWIQGTSALEISSLPILAQALKELEDLLILDKEPLKYTTPTAAPIKKRGNTAKSVAQEPYNRARYWTYLNDRKAGFSELYQFCFVLAKPPQGRNIDIETAIAFWSVLLSPRYPIMSNIIEFLNAKGTYKGANKDLWSMMLEFCRTVDPSLKDYEADGAWPTLLDDFVAWKKSQTTAANNADATDVEME